MSIYSGFATRFQQQSYDQCIDSLLYILQKRVIKFYRNQQADEEKFITLILKLHHQMRNMEKNKYLEPKSSQSLNELIKFMQVHEQNLANYNIYGEGHQTQSEQLPPIQHKPSLPEVVNDKKKKSPFWVQRDTSEKASNKTMIEQQVQTLGTLSIKNYNQGANKSPQKTLASFRKTSYNPGAIRGIKVKNTSRNPSKQRKYQKEAATLELKQPKNRSNSSYLQQKPNIIQSKVTYYANSIEKQQDQKHKPHENGLNQDARVQSNSNRNQVSDIIKQYIIKAKKNYLKTNRKGTEQSLVKLHDF